MSSSIRRRAWARSEGPDSASSWASRLRGDPSQGRGHRAPPGLGGVSREHGVDPHPLDPGPCTGSTGRDGGADVAGVRAATELAVLAPERPGPLTLLGEVGQVQVDREQPRDPLGGVGVEGGDQLGRGLGVVGPAAGLQLVGDVKQVGTPGLAHHLSVQGGEEGQVVEHARHAVQPRVAPLRFVEGVRPSVEFSPVTLAILPTATESLDLDPWVWWVTIGVAAALLAFDVVWIARNPHRPRTARPASRWGLHRCGDRSSGSACGSSRAPSWRASTSRAG